MYELFLIACVGVKMCQYISAPISYPTEFRCHMAAALVAGQVRGNRHPGLKLDYKHTCTRKTDVATLATKRPL